MMEEDELAFEDQDDVDGLDMMDEFSHPQGAPMNPIVDGSRKRPLFGGGARASSAAPSASSSLSSGRSSSSSSSAPPVKKARGSAASVVSRPSMAQQRCAAASAREAAKVHLVPPADDATSVTLPNGQRVYLAPLPPRTCASNLSGGSRRAGQASLSLLKVPIADLNREVEQILRTEVRFLFVVHCMTESFTILSLM